jgi:hypothetical protein
MTFSAKCKCGAEFEVRAMGSSSALADFRVWQAIHNTRCYGVKRWEHGDDGMVHITLLSADQLRETGTG